MKKSLNILIIVLIFNTTSFGQKIILKDAKLESKIIALEKSGWNAWKNKDAEWFKTNTTEEFLSINSEGISNKAQVVKSTSIDCNVNSFLLDNFKFVILNENAVLLIYTAMQAGECGGKKLTTKIRASVNYVKRNGKWLEALYMETAITQ